MPRRTLEIWLRAPRKERSDLETARSPSAEG